MKAINVAVLGFFLILVLLFPLLVGCVSQKPVEKTWARALLVIAPSNFRDEELFFTKEELEKSGVEVDIASKTPGIKTGMLGARVVANLGLNDINLSKYDAVVFIGGSGVPVYYSDNQVLNLAREAYNKGKIVAAICLAPGILAYAGILQGKNATIWDDGTGRYISILTSNGANYVDKEVVISGKVITANGTKAASAFGEEIVKKLKEQHI